MSSFKRKSGIMNCPETLVAVGGGVKLSSYESFGLFVAVEDFRSLFSSTVVEDRITIEHNCASLCNPWWGSTLVTHEAGLKNNQLDFPLLRERVRVRVLPALVKNLFHPHPTFSHLLPHRGEGHSTSHFSLSRKGLNLNCATPSIGRGCNL